MSSDVGRVRSGNEDFSALSEAHGIFVVCDGMGGAAAGEVASHLAANTFVEHLITQLEDHTDEPIVEKHLVAASVAANAAVFQHSRQNPQLRGMGTTLVGLLLAPDDTLWLTHIGDSRCYRLRGGKLELLTLDHSLVQEQILAGQLTPEQAEFSPMRNIITRAVGSHHRVEPEIQPLTAEPGDLYLLCSDGLTRELSDTDLAKLLFFSQGNLDILCKKLIAEANARGGNDNITVLLLRIEEEQQS